MVGLLILIVYYEGLNFGGAMAKRELLLPEIGLWLPFALLLAGTWYLLHRAFRGRRRRPARLGRAAPLEAGAAP